jgi:hypothetical protein
MFGRYRLAGVLDIIFCSMVNMACGCMGLNQVLYRWVCRVGEGTVRLPGPGDFDNFAPHPKSTRSGAQYRARFGTAYRHRLQTRLRGATR